MKDSAKPADTSIGWRWFRNFSIFGALLALYFASAVFVGVMTRKAPLSETSRALPVIEFVYAPLGWLMDHNEPFEKTFDACVNFFCPEDGTTTK